MKRVTSSTSAVGEAHKLVSAGSVHRRQAFCAELGVGARGVGGGVELASVGDDFMVPDRWGSWVRARWGEGELGANSSHAAIASAFRARR